MRHAFDEDCDEMAWVRDHTELPVNFAQSGRRPPRGSEGAKPLKLGVNVRLFF
jgi:hypothetical protein